MITSEFFKKIYFNRVGLMSKLLLILFCCLNFSACRTSRDSAKKDQTKPEVSVPVPDKKPAVPEVKEDNKNQVVKRKFALIMPFELEQNFKAESGESQEPEVSTSALNALNFFEGAKMAIDSLKSQKVEIKLSSFDTPADSAGIVRMLSNAAVKDADMVFAMFPNNLVSAAAGIAKANNVKMILTQAGSPDLLKDNSNIALAYASSKTQCIEMVDFMLDQFRDANIILVYRTVKREDELASIFRDEINKVKGNSDFKEFNATSKTTKEIAGLLNKTKRNLVFLISSDEAFVSPVLSLLEEQNLFGIKVSGLPTWLNFESIDFMNFHNLQVHLFDNNFIDLEKPVKAQFRKAFISRYYMDPMPSAYNGFELIYNIGGSLRDNYESMEKLMKLSFAGSDSYNFSDDVSGITENKNVSVLHLIDYRLEQLNK